MPYFSLRDKPWMPVVLDGGERTRRGLRDILRDAHTVRSVEHPSPLVTAALHRLLLAVLHRALRPASLDEAADWLDNGWPQERVDGYLETWKDRLYLFHETRPFWQTAEFDEEDAKPWAVLAAEHNASSSEGAKILFDFPCRWRGINAQPEDMACWLAAAQTFALPGGRGYSPSPSSGALMTFAVGGTLRETLLLNLPPQTPEVEARDLPVWEREAETARSIQAAPRRAPDGHAHLYTWYSRAVHLHPESDGAVASVGFKPGIAPEKEDAPSFRDPMVAYKDNGMPMEPGRRGLWREFESLLPHRGAGGGKGRAPLVVEHAEALRRAARRRHGRLSVMVCGQINDRAKIESWRMEHFVLPDGESDVGKLLEQAQEWEGWLRNACLLFAGESLRRSGGHRPDPAEVRKVAEHMPCMAVYWNHLEHAFKRGLEKGFDRGAEERERAWLAEIRNALTLAWEAQRRAVGDGGGIRILRAMVKAGGTVGKALQSLPSPE